MKFPDLAIFSLGLKVKGGADNKEDWTVAKYIEGLRLRARATGELKTSNLDTTIKRVDVVKSSSSKNPSDDGTTGDTTPGGGNTPPTGGDTGTDAGTDSGTDSGTGDNGSEVYHQYSVPTILQVVTPISFLKKISFVSF